MSLWHIRAVSHGEFEFRFLDENRVYVTWYHLGHDLKAELPKKRIWTGAAQEERES